MKFTSAEDILFLMDSAFYSAATGAALELGLFWKIEHEPLQIDFIAESLNIPVKRCQFWIHTLQAIGLVDKTKSGYITSDTARINITEKYSQTTWAMLAEESRLRYPIVSNLQQDLQELDSVWDVKGMNPPDYFEQIANSHEYAESFTKMLYEIHQPLAQIISQELDLNSGMSLLDLGGGSGVVSYALAKQNPSLMITIADVASVCEAGKRILEKQAIDKNQITFHSTNFVQDDLPSGFDIILECDVNIYDPILLSKIYHALNPNGKFIIIDQIAPAKNTPHPARVIWGLQSALANPEHEYISVETLNARLQSTGFKNIKHSKLPFTNETDTRFSIQWTVIESYK
jgi:2-polyprenyl-3-methyl-5-hydroxy-6-metoxy-1,4-benzoquinol methylase